MKKLPTITTNSLQVYLRILWQGWHNIGQERSYFHYGPLGKYKEQMWT